MIAWLATLLLPKLGASLARPAAWALAILAALLFAFAAWWTVTAYFNSTAKVEARLGRNSAEAAIKSGNDAVNTIGTQMAGEAATDALTRENDHEIRNAPGADAPVDPAAHAAGLRSLCKRPQYHQRSECLQYAPAR